MQPEFWLERWQKNEIGFHQADGSTYLRRYWRELAVPAGAQVFVPLCGKSTDLLWLREQGYIVVGIELASVAIRDFFAAAEIVPQVVRRSPGEWWQAKGIDIVCGDFFALSRADLAKVGAVFDRAALIALPPPMRMRYAAKTAELLGRGTEILLITMEYEQTQMPGPPFAVLEQEVRTLYAENFAVELLMRNAVLGENLRFRERGLTQLCETVYRLRKR